MNSARQQKYKVDIQKSFAFLYTNNEILERERKKTISFKIALKIPRNKLKQGGKRPMF